MGAPLAQDQLTVACVLRSGGEYGPRHVQVLAAQVAHFMPGTRFACLTDVDVPGVECLPLQFMWPGWWSKVELFDHFKGRTLYLDLDTLVLGNLAPLAAAGDGQFRMCLHPKPISHTDARRVWLSPIMSWQGDYSQIPFAFEQMGQRVMATYTTPEQWGDQAFIAERAALLGPIVDFPARAVAHYRYDCTGGRTPPARALALVFAAPHRPWTVPQAWARRWWPAEVAAA